MRQVVRFGATALVVGLTGCVVAPPQPPPQIPLVALPGPGKTEAQFQQDDTACRAAATVLPASPLPSGAAAPVAATQAAPPQQMPPGAIYLRCMETRNNSIEPLATLRPALYGYYAPYPIYAGFGDTYPWLYGDYYGFGFYGGFGGFRGYNRYGFREGGYRGGGFREGGFREGFGDGGFRGGEFGRRGGFGGERGGFRR